MNCYELFPLSFTTGKEVAATTAQVSNMNYEIVTLEEKTVAGLIARTNNAAPDMGQVIGGLWQQFYANGVHAQIPNKKNEKALGIYTDYEENENADYTVMVATEIAVTNTLPVGVVKRVIPAGNYAKFVVKGHMQKAVAQFWQKLWQMDLPRAYSYDFEEYQNGDMEHAEIHIYISLTK